MSDREAAAKKGLTFEDLRKIEDPLKIPFVGGFATSSQLEDISENFDLFFEFGDAHLYEDGRVSVRLDVFDVKSDEVISFFVTEFDETGALGIAAEKNRNQLEPSSKSDLLNVALYALWRALAAENLDDIDESYDDHDYDFSVLINFQTRLHLALMHQEMDREKVRSLSEKTAGRRLVRLIISIEPRTPDGNIIDLSKVTLPDKKTGLKLSKHQSLDSCPNFIWYEFDDQTILRFDELQSHKYLALVPRDLRGASGTSVPDLSGSFFTKLIERPPSGFSLPKELWLRRLLENRWAYYSPSVMRMAEDQISAFAHALLRMQKNEIAIFMKLDERGRGVELARAITDVQETGSLFVESMDLNGLVGLQTVRTSFATETVCEPSAFVMSLEFGVLDLTHRTLGLSSLAHKYQRFNQPDRSFAAITGVDYQVIDSQFMFQPTFSITRVASGRDASAELLRFAELNRKIQLPPLNRKRVSPTLYVTRKGEWTIYRQLDESSGLNVIGFSRFLEKIMGYLGSAGAIGVFGESAPLIASRRREFRDFELKLLKHQGVLNLLVIEALRVRLYGETGAGHKIKKGKDLLVALAPRILALCGVLTPEGVAADLGAFCSEALQKRFAKLVDSILKIGLDDPERVLTPVGIFELEGAAEEDLRFILAALEFAAVESRGDIFSKRSLSLNEKLLAGGRFLRPCHRHLLSVGAPSFDQLQSDSPFLNIPYGEGRGASAVLEAFSAIDGLQLNFDGQTVLSLTDEMFRSEFEMKDVTHLEESVGLQSRPLNWFELHPRFFLDGKEIALSAAGSFFKDGLVEHEGRFYLVPRKHLPRLSRLAGFWERLQTGKKVGSPRGDSEGTFQIERSQILEMLALRKSGVSFTGGPHWQDICAFYDRLNEVREVQQPKSVRAKLKPYQKQGVARLYDLYRLGLGGLLADDMGLGKTLQALAFLETLRVEGKLQRALIVVPTSLTYNWLSEAERFVPDLPIQFFVSKTRELLKQNLDSDSSPCVVVTTYGLLTEYPDFFKTYDWSVIIFDEAQNMKNIATNRAVVARELRSHAKFCLTGTPLENHLGELFSLIQVVVPGSLGSYDEFKMKFVTAPSVVQSDIEELKTKVRPLILRRTKKEILSELPDKQESRVTLEFESKQKKIYRDIAISYNNQIREQIAEKGESQCQLQMLTALLRLRQACSDPAALPGVKYKAVPPKVETLLESVQEVVESGESALVFTQFVQTLERTVAALRKAGLNVFEIHGSTSRARREKALKEFNAEPAGAVLVMTLKTGGVGLNLTKASYVFHLEPWWNPAVENQATDRAHRMGQKKAVQVYRYIMRESVEEKIELLKTQKQKRFDAVFTESEDAALPARGKVSFAGSSLSQKDFEFLLTQF